MLKERGGVPERLYYSSPSGEEKAGCSHLRKAQVRRVGRFLLSNGKSSFWNEGAYS